MWRRRTHEHFGGHSHHHPGADLVRRAQVTLEFLLKASALIVACWLYLAFVVALLTWLGFMRHDLPGGLPQGDPRRSGQCGRAALPVRAVVEAERGAVCAPRPPSSRC